MLKIISIITLIILSSFAWSSSEDIKSSDLHFRNRTQLFNDFKIPQFKTNPSKFIGKTILEARKIALDEIMFYISQVGTSYNKFMFIDTSVDYYTNQTTKEKVEKDLLNFKSIEMMLTPDAEAIVTKNTYEYFKALSKTLDDENYASPTDLKEAVLKLMKQNKELEERISIGSLNQSNNETAKKNNFLIFLSLALAVASFALNVKSSIKNPKIPKVVKK